MRYIIILFLLISVCFGQSWQPINGKQRFTTGLGVPTKDTSTSSTADTSMITIRPQDSALWVKYKGGWYKVPRITAANPNAILNGGNFFGSTIIIGSNDFKNVQINRGGTQALLIDSFGLTNTAGNFRVNTRNGDATFYDFGASHTQQLPSDTPSLTPPVLYTNLLAYKNGIVYVKDTAASHSWNYGRLAYYRDLSGYGNTYSQGVTPSSTKVSIPFYNGTHSISYTNNAVMDSVTGAIYVNNKRLADTTDLATRLKYTDTSIMLLPYGNGINLRVKYSDTAAMLAAYQTLINARVKYTDTSGMLSAYGTAINGKQATLVSGTNIKTVNGTSVLGSGDITVNGGLTGAGTVTSKVVPLATWSVTNSKVSSTGKYITQDTTNGQVTLNSNVTSSSGLGIGTSLIDTVSASANNDSLFALSIIPTFKNGSYTGVNNYALRLNNPILSNSNGGTVDNIILNNSNSNYSTVTTSLGSVQNPSSAYNSYFQGLKFYTGAPTSGNNYAGVVFDRGGLNLVNYCNFQILNYANGVKTSGVTSSAISNYVPTYLNTVSFNNTTFSTSSGSTNYTSLTVNPTINIGGTYSGIVRGIYYNPNYGSFTSGTQRAIETTVGDVLFNTTSGSTAIGTTPDGVNKLVVNGSALATSFNSNATVTDLTTGSNTITAGHIYFSMPFQGSVTNGGYKKVMIYLNGLSNTTTTITYASSGGIAFTNTPYVYGTAGAVALVTATSTTVTIAAATTATGYIFLEGN